MFGEDGLGLEEGLGIRYRITKKMGYRIFILILYLFLRPFVNKKL